MPEKTNSLDINFEYNKQKDIWCIMYCGASSVNSPTPTSVYKQLTDQYGDNPSQEQVGDFIDDYLETNSINHDEKLKQYQKEWLTIQDNFIARAESIFGVTLPSDITVFLTINNRCPYDIKQNNFFTSISSSKHNLIIMHELWHFYTWHKFGVTDEDKLGQQKYNDLKEALTVLLNIEFPDILKNTPDLGYPQHQELRKQVEEIWNQEKNIEKLWEKISQTKISIPKNLTAQLVTASDWQKFKNIRLESLLKEPQAFGSSYNDEVKRSDDDWQQKLKITEDPNNNRFYYAIAEKNEFIAMGGAYQDDDNEWNIIAIYTKNEHRNQGSGQIILQSIINELRERKAKTAYLRVNTLQTSAHSLYQKNGFQTTQTVKDQLLGDSKNYDEHEMMIKL